MEQDPLLELESGIKTLLDRLSIVEKSSQEHKDLIQAIENKNARLIRATQGSSLQNDILQGLSTNLELLKESVHAKSNKAFEVQTKAATDMTGYPSGIAAGNTEFFPTIQFPPNRPTHIRE